MRGYLVVTADRAQSYYAHETNHVVFRTDASDSGSKLGRKVRAAAETLEPGVYKANSTWEHGRSYTFVFFKVGAKVKDVAREAARLEKLGNEPHWTHHGQGSPGVKGFQERYNAAEEGARMKKRNTRQLAEFLRELAR